MYYGSSYSNDIQGYVIILALVIIFLYFLLRKQPSNIVAHWYHPFTDFNISIIEFYKAVEDKLNELKLPDVYYQQVEYPEASAFSSKRLYLHVYRFEYSFDICAAPFGKEFFISWWLTLKPGCSPFRRKPKPKTFYQLDTEIMFRESISKIVQDIIEDMLQTKGLRSLTNEEKIHKHF